MKKASLFTVAPMLALIGCTSLPQKNPAPDFYLAYPGASDTKVLETHDGLKLYGQWWEPAETQPRAIVLLLHGTAAHTGVYAPWANHLVDHGYAMFAFDMRGWGQSQGFGRAGYTSAPDDYLGDVSLAYEEVRRRYPDVPVYLQGESLGAAVALQWDIRGNDSTDGLILNAPPVVINLKIAPLPQPDWLANGFAWHAGLIGRLFPNAPIYSMGGRTGKWMWRRAIFDEWSREWVANEVNMTHSAIAASYVTNLQKMSAEIRSNFDKIDKPMIVLQGGEDNLVSHKAAKRLIEETPSSEMKKWHFYEDASHCALHDSNKEDVWDDIIDWLDIMTESESSRFVEPQKVSAL
ncbi:alpha/beta fold hydrolase [Alcanivorax sp.]|mgnify:CR=1 FL=1|uniref:alpha/beta fold hydrolase n=1 Tax=Alcanivorax TaxID=59753 RepID=UPI0025C23074|nr:alpha/beta fold hydrolase [Alcanivorax sp.]